MIMIYNFALPAAAPTGIEFIWMQAAMRLLVITVNWFSAYRNRKAVQNASHTIYINHHCWLHCAMHNAKPRWLCKHWKQFSAYDKLIFEWLQIVSRYNWPMDQAFAWSSVSLPVITTWYDQERCVSQIHVNTCRWLHLIVYITDNSRGGWTVIPPLTLQT